VAGCPNEEGRPLSGLLYDIQHAAIYAPYCDGYFTDNAMAKLMKDKRVRVEADYGCKVFSLDSQDDFLAWLEAQESRMTPEHADDLSWRTRNDSGAQGLEAPLSAPPRRFSRP
jgi:hypothetical protein